MREDEKSIPFTSIEKIENIKKMIDEFYGDDYCILDPEVVDDFARLAAVILEPEIVEHYLQILSEAFEKELADRDLLDADKKIKLKSDASSESGYKDYASNYKVLNNFMLKWANKHGFNQPTKIYSLPLDENNNAAYERELVELPQVIPKITGVLDSRMFLALFHANGFLFKDTGVTPRHGEFTHFIQMYIVTEENERKRFLKHSPLELYKLFGTYPYTIGKMGDHNDYLSMWNLIFDVEYGNDNRSPEFLHAEIIGETNNQGFKKENYPILYQMLAGRVDKVKMLSCTSVIDFPLAFFSQSVMEKKKTGITVNQVVHFASMNPLRKLSFYDIKSEQALNIPLTKFEQYIIDNINKDDRLDEQLADLFDLDVTNFQEWEEQISQYEDILRYICNEIIETKKPCNILTFLLNEFYLGQHADKPLIESLLKVAIRLLSVADIAKQEELVSTPLPK